jgi:hypothetical protein
MLKNWYLYGEANFYGQWDYNNFEWSDFVEIPPEKIDVIGTYISSEELCFLKPDPTLINFINSSNMPEQELVKHWDPNFVKSLKANKPHLLPSNRLIRMVNKVTKKDTRGTSSIAAAGKDLMYYDKLRDLQLTFVDRHLFPIKVFKLGDKGLGWIPSEKHFKRFKALLAQASNDPDFNIIYHFGLEIDYIGTKDKIQNLIPEFEFAEKRDR